MEHLDPDHPVRRTAREFFRDLPAEYTEAKSGLNLYMEACLTEFAQGVASRLRSEIASRPIATYEERCKLAIWAGAELRSLRLQFADPETGKPATLIGSPPGRRDERFRMRLLVKGTKPAVRRMLTSLDEVLALPIIPASPRVEPLARLPTQRVR